MNQKQFGMFVRNRRVRKGLLLFLFTFLVICTAGVKGEASSYVYQGIDYAPVFDYAYFAKKYPAVDKTYGGNRAKVFEYFVTTGTKKGLQGSSRFNVTSYAYRYADTRKKFKNDLQKYYIHFCTVGYPKLHRTGVGTSKMLNYATVLNGKNYSKVYDYNKYIIAHPSVKAKYGFDDLKVLEFYVTHDYKEDTISGKVMPVVVETMEIGTTSDLTVRVPSLGDTSGIGDCTLLESAGRYLMIDGAVPGYHSQISTYLKKNGVKQFDIYLSHYHLDHCGSIVQILQDRSFSIGKLYLPDADILFDHDPGDCTTAKSRTNLLQMRKYYDWILTAAKMRGVKVVELKQGSSFTFGICSASVIWGNNYSAGSYDNVYFNNNSLVTKFSVRGNVSFLSTGDITNDAQRLLLNSGVNLQSNFMAMPHHGYTNNMYKDFIDAVKPIYCYYTAYDPQFGKDTLCANLVSYAVTKSNVFSRSVNGEIIFNASKGKIAASASKNTVKVKSDTVINDVIYRRYLKFNSFQKKRFIYKKQTSA